MVKIEILPNFIQRPKINYSTYEKNRFGRVERTLWTSSGCNMGTWRPIITKTPTLLRISWFWVFFKRIFDVNGCVGNKKSTIVDQNYYHQKGLTLSYKKHFYHFLIRHILFSISSFLCWEYAYAPLENLMCNCNLHPSWLKTENNISAFSIESYGKEKFRG